MTRWLKTLVATSSVALLAACGGDGGDDHPGTIAEVATERNLSALVAAADKAGLVDELSAEDAALTVFAPTNAAFDALATTLGFADAGAMVTALDAETLGRILAYHVVAGDVRAADVLALPNPAFVDTLLAGSDLELRNDTLTLVDDDGDSPDATIAATDVVARNGVIHVVTQVLIPAPN